MNLNDKTQYLKDKIYALYNINLPESLNDFNIIDIDDYNDEGRFIEYCKNEINYRVEILKKYNILNFEDCKNSSITEVNKLKEIIIYCGEDNWNVQDPLHDYLYKEYDLSEWAQRFGIMLIVDF